MIEFLSGKILKKTMPHLILNVNGVGYGIELSVSSFASLLAEGDIQELWIFTRVREDILKLYGFLTWEDRRVFEILLDINGVGPKVALAILSSLTVSQLKMLVEQRDIGLLESVPGIGKRTAEKIVVELQSKVEKFPLVPLSGEPSRKSLDQNFEAKQSQVTQDLISALENLGFKKNEFFPILDQLISQNTGISFPDLLRKSLALLKPVERPTRDLDQIF